MFNIDYCFPPVAFIPAAGELVEQTIILVERAQLASQILVDGIRLHRFAGHLHVPDLERHEVTCHQIPTRTTGELQV